MIGFRPLRAMVPTSAAVIWCEPSPVKSTVRRDGSASAMPSGPRWPSRSSPRGSGLHLRAVGEGKRDDPRVGAAVLDDDLIPAASGSRDNAGISPPR